MRHGVRALRGKVVLALAAAGVVAACDDSGVVQPDRQAAFAVNPAAGQTALMKEVRQATSRFNSMQEALRAGYQVASPCVEMPGTGGMGVHFVNNSLVDPVFEPTAPEALVYYPEANGSYRLLAAEYIVIDAGQPAPTFETQAFDVGGTPVPVPHWSLHVWLYEQNPAGTFSPWNPDVVCPGGGATVH